jgi:DNA-binding IclR family transcriptional regulator
MTIAQENALKALKAHQPCTAARLAKLTDFPRQSVSSMLKSLRALGLAERMNDGPKVVWRAVEAG